MVGALLPPTTAFIPPTGGGEVRGVIHELRQALNLKLARLHGHWVTTSLPFVGGWSWPDPIRHESQHGLV